jgi:hypothetical protein
LKRLIGEVHLVSLLNRSTERMERVWGRLFLIFIIVILIMHFQLPDFEGTRAAGSFGQTPREATNFIARKVVRRIARSRELSNDHSIAERQNRT